MKPPKDLPISDEFPSEEEYIKSLLEYVSTTEMYQILCGGVHILDFFTSDPGLYSTVIPPEWQRKAYVHAGSLASHGCGSDSIA